ncbi:Nucleotide-binding, alpha-beta plait domain-containing protein [Rozella allomycis CSF55]|uniref:Nucleotide-binding, alpha-beta plait domain-containing protein n=1 Tax=Rozella allomycis (strain CSF55) TaxID=988480 RepID=A0A075AYS5_ROZAC|nr:Nucleotide-binding, alpha-beta plait domain-containing protein [Rozella allomycis CSF55]|eukprot:EPZ33689.1 Nucleotide-binding, alpha-beta plait domain-containing protein [Rozella allomycis CSF55]
MEHRKSERDRSKSIWVGNLSFTTTRDALEKHFSVAGEITDVFFPRNGYRNKGFAFIDFVDVESRNKAIEMLNDSQLDFRQLFVKAGDDFSREETPRVKREEKHYNDECTIFVGNLSYRAREDQIRDAFEHCGKVVGVRIPIIPGTTKRKGNRRFCYVEFAEKSSVKEAVNMGEIEIDGRLSFIESSK